MALLYIDGIFINPDQIVNVSKFQDGHLTVYLAVTHEDAVARIDFEGEAAKALHYYLFTHKDTVNIASYVMKMAVEATAFNEDDDPQPAPAETPRTVERRFLVDDRVRVKSGKFAGECGSVHDTNLIGTRFTVYLDSDDIHVFSADALELEPNAVDYEEQPIYRND